MILLEAHKISKSFGTDLILADINIEVHSGERVALVGRNGSGKSTLLKILAGELAPDRGDIAIAKEVSIGYLEQNSTFRSTNTIYGELESVFADLLDIERRLRDIERLMAEADPNAEPEDYEKLLAEYDRLQERFTAAGGYTYQADIQSVLNGLGFGDRDPDTPVDALSGGQKTRLALGKLLLTKPDLLILDEPTNHLDIATLTWLENYLKHYPGALLVVSHDRYFLDRLVDKVYEISRGVSKKYHGNYSAYLEQKAADLERAWKAYEKQQKEIRKLEDFIQRNIARASTTKRAQSRRKRLEKMDKLERPAGEERRARIHFDITKPSGRDVLVARGLVYGYEGRKIGGPVSFDLHRGESVALVGPNGIGKTTLLKTIAGLLPKIAGDIQLGANVTIGYFDQEQSGLNLNKTVLNELWDAYPLMDEKDVRTVLGSFLFSGADVLKPVAALSGGEKARLALAKLMLARDNFLILDEPTNHLDLDSKEVLEAALMDFPGTILFVSHDRYFINRLATRIIELSHDGLTDYLGDYDYYVEKKALQEELERLEANDRAEKKARTASRDDPDDYEAAKRKKQEERRRKRRIEELEQEIERLEKDIHGLEQRLLAPEVFNNYEEAQKITKEVEERKQQLDALIDEWTLLQS